MTTNLSKRMEWASASIDPTEEMLGPVARTLYDLPVEGSTEGAREVAQLAAWRAAQEFAFQPVMEALNKLRDRVWDPEQPFMFADSVNFSWKTAPIRKYASFEDFYRRELEETWGKWSDLQETWRKVVKGELTNEQGKKIVLQRLSPPEIMAVASKLPEAMPHAERGKMGGRGKKAGANGTSFPRGSNSTTYLAGRLKRDAPEIAARIDEFPSMRAAAIEAGIIKTEKPLTILRRIWKKASAKEREQITLWVTEQAGWIKK